MTDAPDQPTEAPSAAAERIAEIRKRVAAATPGPWDDDGYCRVLADPEHLWDEEHDGPNVAYVPAWHGDTAVPPHSANMVFIANARADVPYLLAHIDALTAERDDARAALQAAEGREAALRDDVLNLAGAIRNSAWAVPWDLRIFANQLHERLSVAAPDRSDREVQG